jgi:hypothetical protein
MHYIFYSLDGYSELFTWFGDLLHITPPPASFAPPHLSVCMCEWGWGGDGWGAEALSSNGNVIETQIALALLVLLTLLCSERGYGIIFLSCACMNGICFKFLLWVLLAAFRDRKSQQPGARYWNVSWRSQGVQFLRGIHVHFGGGKKHFQEKLWPISHRALREWIINISATPDLISRRSQRRN